MNDPSALLFGRQNRSGGRVVGLESPGGAVFQRFNPTFQAGFAAEVDTSPAVGTGGVCDDHGRSVGRGVDRRKVRWRWNVQGVCKPCVLPMGVWQGGQWLVLISADQGGAVSSEPDPRGWPSPSGRLSAGHPRGAGDNSVWRCFFGGDLSGFAGEGRIERRLTACKCL